MNKQNQRLLDQKNGGLVFSVMMFFYVLINFIGQLICGLVFKAGSLLYMAVASTFSVISLFIATALFMDKSKGVLYSVRIQKFNYKYLLYAVLLSAGMFFGLGFINDTVVNLFNSWGLKVGGISLPFDGIGTLILFSVTFAVLPAIFEEVFFRGVLFNATSECKSLFALIAVSLCFALYHCSVAQFFYQFIYGAGLYLLVKASGSIIPAVISHFLNNFLVILLEYFAVPINLYYIPFIILGLLTLAVYLFLTIKDIKTKGQNDSNQKTLNFYFPYGIFGIAVCLVLAISSLFAVA
jgi:membrane protease YdiL (CAAX protease family)